MSNGSPKQLPPLYSLTAIGIATFLGSALAAGYMLASNYAALGQRKMGMYALYGSIAIVAVLSLVPAQFIDNLPTFFMATIGQVLVALAISNKLQGAMFTTFQEMGGIYYPVWRGILVGIGASFVLLAAMILLVLIFGTPAAT